MEARIRRLIRWNAAVMVIRANIEHPGLGGHLSTYASAASLYEVGFNHFFRGKDHEGGGDQIFYQGHGTPGHVRALVPRVPLRRGPARQLPPGDARQGRAVVVSAPAADAGLLGVPDGVDGTRPDQRDLPGALQPLPARARHQGHVPAARVVLHRRRRDGRARVDGGAHARVARAARQPDLRRQLQPAASRRSGPRQRQGDPGARVALPRRRLARDQGRLGTRVGSAARARRRRRARRQDEHHDRTASSSATRSPTARTSASTSSGPTRDCGGSSSTCPTPTCSACAAADTTTASCTPRTRSRRSSRARRS